VASSRRRIAGLRTKAHAWTNLNDSLALIIQGRCGLVQEKDCGIAHQSTCYGNPLLLAARQLSASLANLFQEKKFLILEKVAGKKI
jgi:hypothetical protein